MRYLIRAMILVLWANASLAHSPLSTTVPADGAILDQPPSELVFEFTGEIRVTRVTLSVSGGSSVDLDLGEQTSFAESYSIPLSQSAPGSYLIEWRGLGSDGHPQTGTFTFTVE